MKGWYILDNGAKVKLYPFHDLSAYPAGTDMVEQRWGETWVFGHDAQGKAFKVRA